MIKRKTLRDLIFPEKVHKDFEKSNKINYAMKTIIRIIIFNIVQSVLLIKIRDYQFVRNIRKLEYSFSDFDNTAEILRNRMTFENLFLIVAVAIISLAILYYCNKKMNTEEIG